MAGEGGVGEEGPPRLLPEQQIGEPRRRDHRDAGGGDGLPAAFGQQRQGQQHTELGLVGQKPEQHARQPRPPVQQHQAPADQGGGEEAVLAMGQVHVDGRESQGGQGRPLLGDDAAHDAEVERQGQPLPGHDRGQIGQERQQRSRQQEHRRIVPAVERDLRIVEGRLLGRIVGRRVVDGGRMAGQGQASGGPDVGEVGAQRAAGVVDPPVRGGDQPDQRHGIGADQDQAVGPQPLGRRPGDGAGRKRQGGFGHARTLAQRGEGWLKQRVVPDASPAPLPGADNRCGRAYIACNIVR